MSTERFSDYYASRHLEKYNYYSAFFDNNDLGTPHSNYTEDDIGTLILISDNRDGIKASAQTRRGLSAELFEDSKYIEEHPGLEKAILKLLELKDFPGQDPKDNQYIFFTPCKTPKAIILCENLHFLRTPWQARNHNIELWYVGGGNIGKLQHIPELTLPIFYSCDWDYDGLSIFQRIKKYIPKIDLLYPSATGSSKTINTQNHRSQWRIESPFSGLDQDVYSIRARALIEDLIKLNEWIEEESNLFSELISLNGLC